MKESQIQTAICDYLALRKHFFWRQNSTPSVYFKGGDTMQFRSMPKYAMRGVPDIIIISKEGKFIGLEVKTEKGKQSDYQFEFAKKCILHNAEYYIVRSIDDVQKIGL